MVHRCAAIAKQQRAQHKQLRIRRHGDLHIAHLRGRRVPHRRRLRIRKSQRPVRAVGTQPQRRAIGRIRGADPPGEFDGVSAESGGIHGDDRTPSWCAAPRRRSKLDMRAIAVEHAALRVEHIVRLAQRQRPVRSVRCRRVAERRVKERNGAQHPDQRECHAKATGTILFHTASS